VSDLAKVLDLVRKTKDLVEQGWVKDALAKDSRGQISDQIGNTIKTFDKKTGEVLKEDFYPAVKWCLTGAMLKASGSERFPSVDFGPLLDVISPAVRKRGFTLVADFNNFKDTKVDDVINLLREVELELMLRRVTEIAQS
jgi:hypothetical protein